MKTKIIKKLTASALITCCVLMSCNEKQKSPSPNTASDQYKEHLIDRKIAQILASEYENGNYKLINANRKDPDSREVYYDLDVLEGYLDFVKQEASKRGIKNPGVKVVMGQYPKDQVVDRRQEEMCKGYQTSYLIPVENKAISKAQSGDDGDGMGDVPALNLGTLTPPH